MSDPCCSYQADNSNSNGEKICPQDATKGKTISLITLKSLLKPKALEQLNPNANYRFCNSYNCSVVYFSAEGQVFTTSDLKVPVFQKNSAETVPVCYCFGWTRQAIREEIENSGESSAVASIMAHVKAKRCGCEVNNPQGSCCLSNLQSLVNQSRSKS